MGRSPSDRRVQVAAGIAAIALLGGCSSGGEDEVATEAGVSLAPAESAAPATTPNPAQTTPAEDDTTTDGAIPANGPTVVDDEADVDAEDQGGDGTTIAVEEVRAGAGDGFIVVYDAGRTILGSEFVAGGIREAVTVTLTTPVQASQHLEAALFRDTDGNRQFDPTTDALVVEQEEPEPEEADEADDPDEVEEPESAEEPIAEDFDYVLR